MIHFRALLTRSGCVAALSFILAAMPVEAADTRYPATPKRPVSDTYHGVTVVDDYRWLEDDANAEVKRWAAEQNTATHRYLDGIAQRPAIAARVGELLRSAPIQHYDFEYRKQLFAMKSQPPKNQPLLVVLPPSADAGAERVILDPNELDDGKGRTTIDFYKPSYDGRYVAVSLSENGSKEGTAYVYDTSTGKRLPDVVAGVNYPTAGGSIEWAADSHGFYYTRYPRGNERPAMLVSATITRACTSVGVDTGIAMHRAVDADRGTSRHLRLPRRPTRHESRSAT